MPTCKKCNKPFKNRVVIDGVDRVINRRRYCLNCSPFGEHNTRQLHLAPNERKSFDNHYQYVKERRKQRKLALIKIKGGCCQICGYNRAYQSLDFHHRDPKAKKFPLSADLLARKSWEVLLEEVAKTVLLCKNCHTEVESGYVEL